MEMAAVESEEEAAEIFRGDLLEIASLLTVLLSHLVPEGWLNVVVHEEPDESNSDDFGPYVVTCQDLRNVLDYRRLLRENEDIQNKLAMVQDIGRSDPRLGSAGHYFAEELKRGLEPNQEHLRNCSVRTRRIDILWTRLEVWWTKIVAQKLLLSPSLEFLDDPTKIVDCCSSPLLNLPGSLHFRKAIAHPIGTEPQKEMNSFFSAFQKNEVECCSLSLPPNKYTWSEFARLCRMVMLLHTRPSELEPRRKRKPPIEEALKSPCCLHADTSNKHKHYAQALAKDFEFTPPHLMALWIRAQRNTQAMRHLWMLFKVFPSPDIPVAPHLNNNHQPPKSIEFAGNPSHGRRRVVDCSHVVDQFVEWAVTNQVLLTHQYVQKHLATSSVMRSKRNQNSAGKGQKSLKRARVDFSNDSEIDLRAAALIFVLRWFVRRNRFVATFFVSKDVGKQYLDLNWTETDQKSIANVFVPVVHAYRRALLGLAKERSSKIVGEDWNLKRVEARIHRTRKVVEQRSNSKDSLESAIYRQMVAMLDALQNSSQWNASQDIQIRNAKEDLHSLYNRFLAVPHVFTTVSELIDTTSDLSASEVSELLLTFPGAFPDSCHVCDETKDEALCACANCEGAFHVKLCSSHYAPVSLSSLAALNERFGKLCLLSQPRMEHIPDFTLGDPLEWTSETFDIERGLRQDNSIAPLGLGLRGVKECAETFRRLSSTGATLVDLAKTHNKEMRTGKTLLPLAGVEDGTIVFDTKVGDFCGKAAGVRPGDVITAVEHLEIPDPAYAHMKKYHDFSRISKASLRNELLKVPSTKLRLFVRRPSRNIVQDSLSWYESLKNSNPGFPTFADTQMEYNICSNCKPTASSPPMDNSPESRSAVVVKQAFQCRAVIRRVGQENFASHFIDEDPGWSAQASQVSHGVFFSLRRLDAMMTSIIARHSLSAKDRHTTSTLSAFMLPPWVEAPSPACRVDWAPARSVDEPLNLLCESLLAWRRIDERDNARRLAKRRMIRLFVMLIPTWCILPSNESTTLRTIGPPKVYLNVREPWQYPSCVFCFARPSEGAVSCGHVSCRETPERLDPDKIVELTETDSPSALAKILDYNEFSSLVGTTVLFRSTDSVVSALKRDAVQFDSDSRCVEYIVASYMPADVGVDALKAKPKNPFFDHFADGSGIFHLFPVVSSDQMKFVLERCQPRKKPSDSKDWMDLSWVYPDALNLGGVARYSFEELEKKMKESDAIRRSIDAFVVAENGVEQNHNSELCLRLLGYSEANNSFRVRSDRYFFDEALNLQLLPPSVLSALSVETRGTEGDGAYDLTIDSTVVILDVLKPSHASCTLVYSDICYVSAAEARHLSQSLLPQNLSCPPSLSGSSVEMTVLLQRFSGTSLPGRYDGIGFGFEVVRWGSRDVFQVGRVHKNSPAFGQLEAGDVILSAGGKILDDIHSIPELVATFLGAPVHIRPISSGGDHLRMALSAVKQSKIPLDSVVLTIHRQKTCFNDDNRSIVIPNDVAYGDSPERQKVSSSNDSNRSVGVGSDVDSGDPAQQQKALAFDDGNRSVGVGNDVASIVSPQQQQANRSAGGGSELASGSSSQRQQALASSDDSISASVLGKIAREMAPQGHLAPASKNDSRSVAVGSRVASGNSPLQQQASPSTNGDRFVGVGNEAASGNSPQHVHLVRRQSHETGRRFDGLSNQWSQNGDESIVIPLYPAETFRFSCDLMQLRTIILRTAAARAPMEESHLYHAAGFGSILTLLECAIFLEAVLKEQPVLGVRLLCPRYTIQVIDQEVQKMASWREPQILSIPRVTKYFYEFILHVDYQRTSNQTMPETGNPFFFEGEYCYRIPVDALPIDRKAEVALKHQRESVLPVLRQSWFHSEFPADRIRGGGPLLPPELVSQSRVVLSSSPGMSTSVHCDSDESEGQDRIGCIASLSVEQWKNQPVYSMVEDDYEGREMLAVGFVHGSTSTFHMEIPDTVAVEVHYLQKLGYISPPQVYPLNPEDTFLIEASAPDEAVAVLQKLQGTLRMTEQFIQGIRDGLKLLGTTPDGREIVWITGDPTALYIMEEHSNLAMDAKDYSSTIASTSTTAQSMLTVREDPPDYCCPWGCSVTNESSEKRYALSFCCLTELHQHCLTEHTFGEARSAIRIRRDKRFIRITEGEAILKLCADVAAAVIAHFPDLQMSERCISGDPLPINRLPSGIEFSKSPTGTKSLLAWSDATFRENLLLKALPPKPRSLHKVVNLWSAIGCVFECEVSGRFRLSQIKFEAMMHEKSHKPKINDLPTTADCCQFVSRESSRDCRRFQGCSLCSLPWERCVGMGAIDKNENSSRGLGCVLLSDVSFNNIIQRDTSELHGSSGEAKELLLRVAALVQEGLRSKGKVGVLDPAHGHRLWDDDNYKSWETFVGHCTTPRMFSQALVVLMGSIDRSKMPRWWKQEGGGWSTFQSVMANANMDSFFLQLHVLDAALSETIGRSLMGEKSAKLSKKTSTSRNAQQAMARWLTLAMEPPSFAPFNGMHGNECLYCDDGGELLCCEFCQNVAHAECCDPVIQQEEITNELKWICDSCINDICQGKGIVRETLDS